jgi:hypothetical protein
VAVLVLGGFRSVAFCQASSRAEVARLSKASVAMRSCAGLQPGFISFTPECQKNGERFVPPACTHQLSRKCGYRTPSARRLRAFANTSRRSIPRRCPVLTATVKRKACRSCCPTWGATTEIEVMTDYALWSLLGNRGHEWAG